MSKLFSEHFQRVEDGANSIHTLTNLSKWISENTYIEGKLFSYKKHEYQPNVIDDPAKTTIVVKCAQVGLSEIFARWGMAACTTQDNFTLIWTFPSSTDAENFSKARLDPLINASPAILTAINKSVNSVALKQFNENSFAYIRGTISETGGLSVPADLLIHDEYDKSDMDNISTYVSRLQHKPTKMRRIFSTPTVDKYGISKLAETSIRKRQMWRCNHCNHTWLPSYELDVKIPGYDGAKKEITKSNIKNIRWSEAKLLCPHCGKLPDSSIENREWVIENTLDNYPDSSWFISPFCAPEIITPSYLVVSSTIFNKWSEFCNQALGLVAEDAEEMLTEGNVRKAFHEGDLNSSEVHYLGADMGLICHIMIGRRTQAGELIVVHRERVPYNLFENRRRELIKKFRVIISVHDVMPYTDIIKRLTDSDPNAYGALYVTRATTDTHTIKEAEEDADEGRLNLRMAQVNRNVTFDAVMNEFKAGTIVLAKGEDEDEVTAHMLDLKRIQKFDKFGGVTYVWEKTTGQDHYFHTLCYLFTACNLRGTASSIIDISTIGIVRAVKTKW